MGRHEVLSVVFSIENNALLPGKKITLNIGLKQPIGLEVNNFSLNEPSTK
jgi:hypothetical protein